MASAVRPFHNEWLSRTFLNGKQNSLRSTPRKSGKAQGYREKLGIPSQGISSRDPALPHSAQLHQRDAAKRTDGSEDLTCGGVRNGAFQHQAPRVRADIFLRRGLTKRKRNRVQTGAHQWNASQPNLFTMSIDTRLLEMHEKLDAAEVRVVT